MKAIHEEVEAELAAGIDDSMELAEVFIGVDPAQVRDACGIAVVERVGEIYTITRLERRKYVAYPFLYEEVKAIASDFIEPTIVVDAGGVGRAFYDQLRVVYNMNPKGIVLSGGDNVKVQSEYFASVPPRNLYSTMKILLQNEQVEANKKLPLADEYKKEMGNIDVKINQRGHDTYGATGYLQHDDLVMSALLACWWAEHGEDEVGGHKIRYRGTSAEFLTSDGRVPPAVGGSSYDAFMGDLSRQVSADTSYAQQQAHGAYDRPAPSAPAPTKDIARELTRGRGAFSNYRER